MPIVATTVPDPMYKNLGAGHYMRTHADLYHNGGIAAWTRTESVTWFGGYIGTVVVVVVDANGTVLGKTDQHNFGVNGTAFGGSDRTDTWFHTWDPAFAERAVGGRLYAVHGWRFEARFLTTAVEVGKAIGPFLAFLL